MFLHKLYSEPAGLFKEVEFKNGVNFIFARKDNDGDPKKSLNGVGKSLLLNLLDYALFSAKTPHIKSFENNNDTNNYKLVLEFFIGKDLYVVKRDFNNPNKGIIFGKKGFSDIYDDLSLVKSLLCDLIFKKDGYKGNYSNKWLRKLLPFYIKKQESRTKMKFNDPIKYIQEITEMEILQYHLFLLGINNSLFHDNFINTIELKELEPALKSVEKLVKESYGLDDISKAGNRIDTLKIAIDKDKSNIETFKLSEQYNDVEKESNYLTEKIKELFYLNHQDYNKIRAYENSYTLNDDIKTTRIKNIYADLNILLADNIKKTLDEAIKFRKEISKSRKKFLKSEIYNIKEIIKQRDDEINNFENERRKLFDFLSAKEAIKDLSEAYLELSRKSDKLSNLESKLKTFYDLRLNFNSKKLKSQQIYTQILSESESIKGELLDFKSIFFELHNFIYPENKDKNFGVYFEINENKDSKVDMNVILPSELSYGKNKAKTLLYDLSVLFYGIKENFNAPRFLVHDGIFDGIDKAHFIKLYQYLKSIEEQGVKFQYIVTLNQEGDITEDIGNTGILTNDIIEEESIITLKPSNKLCNKDWD